MTYSNRWNRLIYTLWAPIYDALIGFHPAAEARSKAFEIAQIDDAANVLLAGVGTGIDLEFVNPATAIVGLDLSPAMLARTCRQADRLDREIQAVCGNLSTLPFCCETFDAVVLTLVVSVVPDPRQCLVEALRVVKPEGRVLVMDKFLPHGQRASVLRRGFNLLARFFGTDINRSWEEMSADLPVTLVDEYAVMNGSFRALVLEKRGDQTAADDPDLS